MAVTAKQVRESFSCTSRADVTALPDLTPEERKELIEDVIDRKHGGRMERDIRNAESRSVAIDVLRRDERYHGTSGPSGISHSGHVDGILAWIEEWEPYAVKGSEIPHYRFIRGLRSGFITYGEVVDYVRKGTEVAVQLSLLTETSP